MGKLLVVLLALLAPSFAAAAPMQDQHGQWWDVLIPPFGWFDKPYLNGKKPKVIFLPEARLMGFCSAAIGRAEPFGCSDPFNYATECPIYISADLPKPFRD